MTTSHLISHDASGPRSANALRGARLGRYDILRVYRVDRFLETNR
jgi:hypothetical protein